MPRSPASHKRSGSCLGFTGEAGTEEVAKNHPTGLPRDSLKLLVPFMAFEGVKLMISCQVLV